jgi:hypothetical protein
MHLLTELYTLPAKDLFNFERHYDSRRYQYRLTEESYEKATEGFEGFEKQGFVSIEEVMPDVQKNLRNKE